MSTRKKEKLRLEQLYEISKHLALTESIDETFDAVISIAQHSLPLARVTAIDVDQPYSKIFVWPRSPGGPTQEDRLRAATVYRYFTEPSARDVLPVAANTIVLPLVVAHRKTFGALLVDTTARLQVNELMFVTAIGNQLATALDRARGRRQDVARRDSAEAARIYAEARGVVSERRRVLADAQREEFEALAAENARLYEQAQRAVRTREQILAIVSHDLRNPLATILMTASALAQINVPVERREALPKAVGRIKRAADRMQRLIEDLLDFASVESETLAIKAQEQDPGRLLAETVAGFEAIALEKGLELTAEIAPDLPPAYCDRDRILQVLGNLVGNAIKAASTGARIALRVAVRGEDLLFSVADTGPGIREEDVAHIFDRYWRSPDSHYQGTGLGLAIARGIVSAHGGHIWAESKLGDGATFLFTIPSSRATPIPIKSIA